MEYRIINIIDKFSVIINYGKEDGAKRGNQVRVFKEGEAIYDGEKYLGSLDIVKADLEIVMVYEKFSICKCIERTTRNPFMVLNFERTVTEVKELNVEKEDFSNLKYRTNEPLKIGDSVKII